MDHSNVQAEVTIIHIPSNRGFEVEKCWEFVFGLIANAVMKTDGMESHQASCDLVVNTLFQGMASCDKELHVVKRHDETGDGEHLFGAYRLFIGVELNVASAEAN